MFLKLSSKCSSPLHWQWFCYLIIINFVKSLLLCTTQGSSWFDQIKMRARSICEGGKYIFPFKRHFILNSTMNSWMQAIIMFLIYFILFCCINIAICCLWWVYNLWCWKMLSGISATFCWPVDQLFLPTWRTILTQGKWWLKANVYVNLQVFGTLFLWVKLMHLYLAIFYSMKWKMM